MIVCVAIGCNSKVDHIMQGAEDVDQHSQRIQEEANPKK
jgi:hypothetical protein